MHLLAAVDRFTGLGRPLLLGASSSIFLGQLLGLGIDEREAASVAAAAIGVLRGCRVLRVHDARGAPRRRPSRRRASVRPGVRR